MTAYFAQVREGGRETMPKFEGGLSSVSSGCGESGEVCCSVYKLVPEVGRCIACKAHGPHFPKDCLMEVLCTSILCRHIGGHQLVIDAFGFAPSFHVFGDKFTIVSQERAKLLACLGSDHAMPVLKCGGSFAFSF